MALHLDARITRTGTIDCTLSSDDTTMANPVIGFSLMVPPRVISGGKLLDHLGGFGRVRLAGTLTPDTPLNFELAHQQDFKAANRAWLPLSPYVLRPDGTTQPITTGPAGVICPIFKPEPPTDLGLVPVPTHWEPDGSTTTANGFVLTATTLWPDVTKAIADLVQRVGQPSLFTQQGLALTFIRTDHVDESYDLHITPQGINLFAGTESGARYGLISLIILRAVHNGRLPTGTIKDRPRFAWRGQHLDCARHFFAVESIERLLDLMALLKLNRFHWHFADDEAFRLHVDCHPDLWQKSSHRGEGHTLPGIFGGGAGPTGGSYSKDDARHLIAHAADLGIEILPEIEVPAHALAITEIYPELRDPDDTGTEYSVQGYRRNTVNPALPRTWAFLEPLALEVAALFPFGHLHIGGDELPENTWAGSPAVDAMKTREGLTDHVDVQGHTMERLAKRLAAAGIQPCAWEEAALGRQGGIGHDAILFSWSGQGPGLAAARRGYRVVMCPAQHAYWDMAHTTDPDDWGANWAANFDLAATLAWDPIPEDEPELANVIIGVEGAFWGEFTTRDWQMEAMIAPRILGLATVGWSTKSACTPDHLKDLARGFQTLFDTMNWRADTRNLL